MRIYTRYNIDCYSNLFYAGKSAIEWTDNALKCIDGIDSECILELISPMPLLCDRAIKGLIAFISRKGLYEIDFPSGRLINPHGKGALSRNGMFSLSPSPINDSVIESELYKRIALEHIERGVFISPSSVFIDSTVKIERGVKIYGYALIKGDTYIGQNSEISFSEIHSSEIGQGVIVRHSVIEEAHIGDGCKIGPFSYIRPKTSLGQDVRVGDFVEIKQSVVGSSVKVAHLAYIGNANVGNNTNVGCGTVFANYDGKEKHSTTVGENVFIGCNTNLVAPINVGNNCFIAAGSTITDDMPDNSFAIARERQITKKDKKPS